MWRVEGWKIRILTSIKGSAFSLYTFKLKYSYYNFNINAYICLAKVMTGIFLNVWRVLNNKVGIEIYLYFLRYFGSLAIT